ncbi:Panacea domain-containing protein [Neptunomonas antarctica]|uniref:Uncharacterized phage-associated protein n=1 Tax=Neptunomonas antarctica TaxID=619304 RepID=A0A1N7J5N6_9GAMM|nr:type II toxin-antitoxin system antitoxin SocA domain-containing protein [Neptunomonas antarctica]SIS44551.1 Uncharacterized phage-associated protein [Neptunomonas antarctica]
MSSADINEVASYLILKGEVGITHRELQKLLYFSQGFYLAQYGEPLFDADMAAWQFGPVNVSIWSRFKSRGYSCLSVSKDVSTITLDDTRKKFLAGILASFLVLGQSALIDMSHTDYPWERNYIADRNNLIEKDLIKEYFNTFESQEQYIKIAKEKVEFSNLIDKRTAYLSSLDEIGDDWISGVSVAPTKEICDECKKFLNIFRRDLFAKNAVPKIPKLLLGPIPTGGVGIELHLENKNIYLHFHNESLVEVSIEVGDNFEEYDIVLEDFNKDIGVFLERVA